jgi:hypothetical protein
MRPSMSLCSTSLPDSPPSQHRCLVGGVFIVFLAIYVLSGPGRIDMIDGQYRFEVAWNLLETGRPIVRDIYLNAREGLDGARYSFDGLAGSLVSIPLVWLGFSFGGDNGELGRFLFSFTSAGFAAAALALLLHWWLRLGIAVRKGLAWIAVVGLATLLWPVASSTFHQPQHAFFVLASAYAGTRASEGHRAKLWALTSGLLAGFLVLYQLPYAVLGPLLAVSLIGSARPIQVRPLLPRLALFGAAFVVCVGGAGLFNLVRFGSPTDIGSLPGPPLWGNPFHGVPGLLVSPGKGILWYSPVIVLQLLGLRALWRFRTSLALTAIAMPVAHFAFLASVSFYNGDWCWGPRYLVATLPLLALGLPFLTLNGKLRRWAAGTLIGLGALVQVAALSVDHQGFFFAHALPVTFWTDPVANYRHSQLAYRMTELRELFAGNNFDYSGPFRPGPYPGLPTYCIFGMNPRISPNLAPEWMKAYPIFYVSRPWPLWMPLLPRGMQPISPLPAAVLFALMGGAGVLLIRRGLRGDKADGVRILSE